MGTTPKPYYEEDGVIIYHGDARELIGGVGTLESVISDPVWPNSVFPEVADPQQLFAETMGAAPSCVRRVVVHLGCDSDPRFLGAVPRRWPFIRVCDLDYARPTYKGKIVQGGDIAYVFGDIPDGLGRKLLPGRCISTKSDRLFHRSTWLGKDKHFTRRKDASLAHEYGALAHPCARRLQHVLWLVKWFGGGSVCDPFLGSGTTALACKRLGVPFVGIEIKKDFCDLAVSRLSQGVLDLEEELRIPVCLGISESEERTACMSSRGEITHG
jgi:hypothetical protein